MGRGKFRIAEVKNARSAKEAKAYMYSLWTIIQDNEGRIYMVGFDNPLSGFNYEVQEARLNSGLMYLYEMFV